MLFDQAALGGIISPDDSTNGEAVGFYIILVSLALSSASIAYSLWPVKPKSVQAWILPVAAVVVLALLLFGIYFYVSFSRDFIF